MRPKSRPVLAGTVRYGLKAARYTANYQSDFVAKVSTLATFSCHFLSFRITSEGVATLVIFMALWRCEKN